MSLEVEKTTLEQDLKTLTDQLEEKKRRLAKLNKVQTTLFSQEPAVGTVLRFTRALAGSVVKYTFVAYRASSSRLSAWHVTGKKNTLHLIGLKETGNSWEDLLVAIGDSKVEIAVDWVEPGKRVYDYFRAHDSGKVFRSSQDQRVVEVLRSDGSWRLSPYTTRDFVLRNPGSYHRISSADVSRGVGSDDIFG